MGRFRWIDAGSDALAELVGSRNGHDPCHTVIIVALWTGGGLGYMRYIEISRGL